jgi:hypothetical protein
VLHSGERFAGDAPRAAEHLVQDGAQGFEGVKGSGQSNTSPSNSGRTALDVLGSWRSSAREPAWPMPDGTPLRAMGQMPRGPLPPFRTLENRRREVVDIRKQTRTSRVPQESPPLADDAYN